MKTANANVRGAASLVLAMLIFSLQDIAVKWIGGDYPVLEIVIFQSDCPALHFYLSPL